MKALKSAILLALILTAVCGVSAKTGTDMPLLDSPALADILNKYSSIALDREASVQKHAIVLLANPGKLSERSILGVVLDVWTLSRREGGSAVTAVIVRYPKLESGIAVRRSFPQLFGVSARGGVLMRYNGRRITRNAYSRISPFFHEYLTPDKIVFRWDDSGKAIYVRNNHKYASINFSTRGIGIVARKLARSQTPDIVAQPRHVIVPPGGETRIDVSISDETDNFRQFQIVRPVCYVVL